IATKKRNLITLLPILAIVFFLGGYPIGPVAGTIYQHITIAGLNLTWSTIYLSFAAIGLVLVILHSSQLSNFLKRPKISILGKYTFSLYLVHLTVLYTFGMALFLLLKHKIGIGYNASAVLSIILSIPVIAGATILFEKYIDSPSIKFSSVFANALLNGYDGKAIKARILKPARTTFIKIKKLSNRTPTEVPEEAEV
ncbi:MAG TPA: acyltransferase family protein, partial [Dongiaceae bacterium]|nr:acyltransferase family protein [Dongiaceae bacterium]